MIFCSKTSATSHNGNLCLIFAVTIGIVMFGPNTPVSAKEDRQILTMATPEGEGIFTQYLERLYAAMSKESGFHFVIKEFPKKRAMFEANYGQADGLAARIKGLHSKKLPNIRIVNESLYKVQHALFAKRPDTISTFRSLNDMIQNGQVVGYLRGSKKANELLAAFPKNLKIVFERPEEAIKLLLRDRFSAFLAGPAISSRILLRRKFPDSGIKQLAIVSESPLFPYLHKSHQDLIPRVERALRTLRKNGTIAKLLEVLE